MDKLQSATEVPARQAEGFFGTMYGLWFRVQGYLVAERIHFTLFGIILPTIKLKV